MTNRWAGVLFAVLSAGILVGDSACSVDKLVQECKEPNRWFHCDVTILPAAMCGCEPYKQVQHVCAPSTGNAPYVAQEQTPLLPGSRIVGVVCHPVPIGSGAPNDADFSAQLRPQTWGAGGGPPAATCDADPIDNTCRACAKVYCCSEFQACMADSACTCWADCLAAGQTQAACLSSCGNPDMITTTTAACLMGVCASECPVDACMCAPSGSPTP